MLRNKTPHYEIVNIQINTECLYLSGFYFYYFSSVSINSNDGEQGNEEGEINTFESSDLPVPNIPSGLEDDIFLAHLESQTHIDASPPQE